MLSQKLCCLLKLKTELSGTFLQSVKHISRQTDKPTRLVQRWKSTMAAPYYSFSDPEISKFIDDAFKIIKEEALVKGTDRSTPIVEFKQPKELMDLLELDIKADPAAHDNLLEDMRKIIKYSVKTGHPHFYNQLYAGIDPYSQVGSWLTESLNTNIHTYEVSPVFIVMEKYLFKKMCSVVGFPRGDGIFCPGGSASNIMALNVARYKKFPEVRTQGMYGMPRMRCYVSEDGHYSLKKATNYLGFGTDNVVPIKTDARGKLMVEDLEAQILKDIAAGYAPTMAMATCGSTVLGSYDDLPAMNELCKKHGIWLHADACWGGGVLMSRQHRHLMTGVELCDSVAWNFHKFFGTTLQAAALLLKEETILYETNSLKAEYLFQPDKFYDVAYDIGDKTVQCGRKVDVVKTWMQWKAAGDLGLEILVDRAYDNTRYLQEKLKATEGFRLVMPEFECTNTCFWYIPPRLRGQEETEEWWAQVGKIAPKVKELMVKEGTMMINNQPMTSKGHVNFFRPIIHNPGNTYADMDAIIREIQKVADTL